VAIELLNQEADANLDSIHGLSPLMVAARAQNAYLVKKLLELSVYVNTRDRLGKTALIHAVEAKDIISVQALIDQGAQVDVSDNEGFTALIHASKSNELGVLQALLKAEVQVNLRTREGYTALMFAAEKGNEPFVRALLRSGASVATKNNEGHRAVDIASTRVKGMLIQEMDAQGFHSKAEKEDTQNKVITVKGESEEAQEEAVEEEEEPVRVKKTRLRLKGQPLARWVRGKGLKIDYIEANVRNSGRVTANDITVTAIVPGGKRIELTGPTELKRNKTAKYTYEESESLSRTGRIKVEMTCSNCYR